MQQQIIDPILVWRHNGHLSLTNKLLLDLQQKYKQYNFRLNGFICSVAECLSMHTN